MNELISVIVPVYKVEPYLERCIQSILSQTYTNLEIILVDDGSPDRCGEICDRYAREDSRIRVFHKENGGVSDARNYGVEQSSGKYISFIDADDYISPDYYFYLLSLLKKYDADISCCCIENTSRESTKFDENMDFPEEVLFTGVEACRELMGRYYDILVVVWGKIYKSEIVKQYSFPLGKRYEDEAIICSYLYSAKNIVIGNRRLYAYYQNPNSFMHNQSTSRHLDIAWVLEQRAEFFEKHHEKKLAKISWNHVLNKYIIDSMENNGRSDCVIREFIRGKSLDVKTVFSVILYRISPNVHGKCLKIQSKFIKFLNILKSRWQRNGIFKC